MAIDVDHPGLLRSGLVGFFVGAATMLLTVGSLRFTPPLQHFIKANALISASHTSDTVRDSAGRLLPANLSFVDPGVDCVSHGTSGSCRFRNVCFVPSNLTILLQRGRPLPAFDLWAGASPEPSAGVKDIGPFNPKLHVQHLPADFQWPAIKPGVTIASWQYEGENLGHVLGDEVWAAFQALALWGLLDQANSARVMTTARTTPKSQKLLRQYHYLSDVPPVSYKQLTEQGQVHCFDTLLAGQLHLGFWWNSRFCPEKGTGFESFDCRAEYLPEFKALLRAFRRHAMQRFNLTDVPQPHSPKIVFLQKDVSVAANKFVIKNMDECVNETARRFPTATVVPAMWTKHSFREMLEIMSSADVVISVPGSDVMTGVWMPPTGEIIQVCRYYDNGNPDRGLEQQKWLHVSHHLQIWCHGLEHAGTMAHGHIILPIDALHRRIQAALSRQQAEGVVDTEMSKSICLGNRCL